MRTVAIPPALRDILGRRQRPWELGALFGITLCCTTLLALADPSLWQPLAWWQRTLAVLLVLDIVAGCLANFTSGTNDHYAASARRRVVFLVIHLHLLLLHWALHQPLVPAIGVWLYAVAGAAVVSNIKDRELQLFTGAGLLVAALAWTPLLKLPAALLAVHLLFVMKLVLSFAVDHNRKLSHCAPARPPRG